MTAAALTPTDVVTAPGLYDGMTDGTYHADPVPDGSLSSSGARKLLPPYCPAIYRYEQDHGQAPKQVFDFGHAAHSLVLGVGAEIVTVVADDWRTKAAKEQAAEARADGKVPLLAAEVAQVEGMAQAILRHPIAAELFDPDHGKPEQSAFWQDEQHGVWRRARFDWLPEVVDGRLIIVDYKSTVSAEPGAVARSFAKYGYASQASWYVDAAHALGLADEVGFLFVFQEKTAPYLVTVVQPDQEALAVGRALNDRALEVYAECRATGTWPSYSSEIQTVSLPAWAVRDFQELILNEQ